MTLHIVDTVALRRLIWAGHVARLGWGRRNAYRVWWGNLFENVHFEDWRDGRG
jgi:hypothetical protein